MANKFLDNAGLTYLASKIKALLANKADASKLNDYVKKAGDTMSGPLTVIDNFNVNKTFDDVEYKTYVRPVNYELGGEYTTGLIHFINGVNNAQFLFNKNGVALRDNVNSKLYEIFGQYNPDSVRTSIHYFFSLAEIGLTEGSETIESIATALPQNSVLVFTVSTNSPAIYPTNYGLVTVKKTVASRIVFEFNGTAGSYFVGHYSISSNGNVWSGWKECPTDAVRYTTVQSLTDAQEQMARTNIGIETGTWTAALNLGTISAQRCTYVKVGNMVTISFFIKGTGATTNGQNTYLCITGAPFAPQSGVDWYGGGCHVQGLADIVNKYPVTGCAILPSKLIYIRTAQAGGGSTGYVYANNSATAFLLSGTITYPV